MKATMDVQQFRYICLIQSIHEQFGDDKCFDYQKNHTVGQIRGFLAFEFTDM